MSRVVIPFNQNWKFSESFREEFTCSDFNDENFTVVTLPHANKEIPYNYFDEKMYQFVSCYRKTFNVPREFEGKNIFVDFEGVMTYAKVYINGEFAGEHKGGYTPFSIELTKKINFQSPNVLTVMVDSTERPDIPPFGYVIDYLTYGGIYREVNLRIVDAVFIENVFVKPRDILQDKKRLETLVFLSNQAGVRTEAKLELKLKFEKETIAECIQTVKLDGEKETRIKIEVSSLEGIRLWSLDAPNLYTVEVSFSYEGRQVDSYEVRTGFREAILKTDGFYLNGSKVKIRGLNRHQAFPYVGYAMPARVQRKDADILKDELHLNAVRTSHYPQSRHFLDRCDEIGLLVLEEIPGWQHIGDEGWKQVACRNVREMIVRDWNHPSIFLWGVRINESKDDHDFYTETNRIAHELDDTRQTGGIRCYRNSELLEDVYTMNDFSHSGGEVVLQEQRTNTGLEHFVPYMVTEYNGHMYPTKRFDQEERLMEHALRHVRVQNAAGLDNHICGAIGWCAFDYNTHYDFGSGDRICYHGVMDMFRIPKFAANVYRSQVSPETDAVLEPVTLWARGERSIGGVAPLVILTNCEYVEFYNGSEFIGKFYPSGESYPGLPYPPIVIKEFPGGVWGMSWDNGEFIGYTGGREVIRKKFSKNPTAEKLAVKADDTKLLPGEMDATRVVYKIVDQYGNIVPYVNEIIKFAVSGPGEIVGPTETALIGGCIAVWVRTTGEKGEIKLSAACSRFAAEDVRITVE